MHNCFERAAAVAAALTMLALYAAGARAAEPYPACPKTRDLLSAGAEPVRIACFGDSLTGVYYHTGGRRAYADLLAIALKRIYPRAKIETFNAGISGDTTRGALERIDRDVLAHRPHLVTIMFGMNDMTRVPPDEYRANLAEIVARCRQAGAEVILCTSNSVRETPGRPMQTLERFMQIVRELGRELSVPVADCFAAFEARRAADPAEWSLLLSDEIHPNMDGHKRIAEKIAATLGKLPAPLNDVGPPQPEIPRTLRLLRAGEPVHVFAMPPYDKLIGPALRELAPGARIEVETWPVEGLSLAEIEKSAKDVRARKQDLVIVAIPPGAASGEADAFHRSFAWVLNWSLSFGRQEWDCIALSPSVADPEFGAQQRKRDDLIVRIIRAQDLGGFARRGSDARPAAELLREWLRTQWDTSGPADR